MLSLITVWVNLCWNVSPLGMLTCVGKCYPSACYELTCVGRCYPSACYVLTCVKKCYPSACYELTCFEKCYPSDWYELTCVGKCYISACYELTFVGKCYPSACYGLTCVEKCKWVYWPDLQCACRYLCQLPCLFLFTQSFTNTDKITHPYLSCNTKITTTCGVCNHQAVATTRPELCIYCLSISKLTKLIIAHL